MDCIQLDLSEVDVFSARKVSLDGDNFKIVRQVSRTSHTSYVSEIHTGRCWSANASLSSSASTEG